MMANSQMATSETSKLLSTHEPQLVSNGRQQTKKHSFTIALGIIAGFAAIHVTTRLLGESQSFGSTVLTASQSEGNTYCGRVIGKYTQSVADPLQAFEWYETFLNAACQSYEKCTVTCEGCGEARRAALPMTVGSKETCFGLHVVDAINRPQGSVSIRDMVSRYVASLSAFSTYMPMMDQAIVLYAHKGDSYVKLLEKKGENYLVSQWTGEGGEILYSIFAHIVSSMSCVEIVTTTLSDKYLKNVYIDDAVRLPAKAFKIAGVNTDEVSDNILYPLAISKATSNMTTISTFYEDVMQGEEIAYSQSKDVPSDGDEYKVFRLQGADMAIRFVKRAKDRIGSLSVAEMESIKNAAHVDSYSSAVCGVDRYYDNHFSYSPGVLHDSESLGDLVERLDSGPPPQWHCQKNGIYALEPTGDAIYVAPGAYSDYLDFNTGNAILTDLLSTCWYSNESLPLSDLCAQGDCAGTSVYTNMTCDGFSR